MLPKLRETKRLLEATDEELLSTLARGKRRLEGQPDDQDSTTESGESRADHLSQFALFVIDKRYAKVFYQHARKRGLTDQNAGTSVIISESKIYKYCEGFNPKIASARTWMWAIHRHVVISMYQQQQNNDAYIAPLTDEEWEQDLDLNVDFEEMLADKVLHGDPEASLIFAEQATEDLDFWRRCSHVWRGLPDADRAVLTAKTIGSSEGKRQRGPKGKAWHVARDHFRVGLCETFEYKHKDMVRAIRAIGRTSPRWINNDAPQSSI